MGDEGADGEEDLADDEMFKQMMQKL